ncbi:glycosyltransferase family 1 protein [Sphaerobolus stellatus SS14]|uniref:UDP-N-acetylglucosamine transferase subunit ALG14 n=1 Tax=Sphaerobolus stellatus (strain SS14) TaxID=990650 RepID=A0A0C9VRL3_SPHS4|nr:glycosyltransferase family 1 protein [Sphaerobolus stellatus SS14]
MLSLFLVLFLVVVFRLYLILPSRKSKSDVVPTRSRNSQCHLAVFLGSGGHTSEALTLLSSIYFERYTPRTYIVSQGDTLSIERARAFEESKAKSKKNDEYRILEIPRARRVHQFLLTTPPTALRSAITCIYHVCLLPVITGRPFADILLVNGPGTCVILCAAAYASRLCFIPSPRLIYVESFARVDSLSLSGRILRPFVDRFLVQWPELLKDGGRGEYRGWLV